jgi:hypothetical protein
VLGLGLGSGVRERFPSDRRAPEGRCASSLETTARGSAMPRAVGDSYIYTYHPIGTKKDQNNQSKKRPKTNQKKDQNNQSEKRQNNQSEKWQQKQAENDQKEPIRKKTKTTNQKKDKNTQSDKDKNNPSRTRLLW